MKCPYCGATEDKVVDSRATEESDATRRRRECLKCEKRFTTFERIEEVPLTVIKKNDEREPFDRSKLLAGIQRATIKRRVSANRLEKIVHDIEQNLETSLNTKFLPTSWEKEFLNT